MGRARFNEGVFFGGDKNMVCGCTGEVMREGLGGQHEGGALYVLGGA